MPFVEAPAGAFGKARETHVDIALTAAEAVALHRLLAEVAMHPQGRGMPGVYVAPPEAVDAELVQALVLAVGSLGPLGAGGAPARPCPHARDHTRRAAHRNRFRRRGTAAAKSISLAPTSLHLATLNRPRKPRAPVRRKATPPLAGAAAGGRVRRKRCLPALQSPAANQSERSERGATPRLAGAAKASRRCLPACLPALRPRINSSALAACARPCGRVGERARLRLCLAAVREWRSAGAVARAAS